jgi:hypothetical protein
MYRYDYIENKTTVIFSYIEKYAYLCTQIKE